MGSNINFHKVVDQLCDQSMNSELYHLPWHKMEVPSIPEVQKLIELLREIIFPGYFGESKIRPETLHEVLSARIQSVYLLLIEQIYRGSCFYCYKPSHQCVECEEKSHQLAARFIEKLPSVKHKLALDVLAAYNGDPSIPTISEAVFCNPGITAITCYRIAYELVVLKVPLIPRIISEIAHSITGIDINPEAVIGEKFFIDHGTGVVIGQTAIIGNNVKIYQGVTLGAKSFPVDSSGNPVKDMPRHPIIEDNVIIYSNATILGRVTIGKGAIIGGNVWIIDDVPPGTRVNLKMPHP